MRAGLRTVVLLLALLLAAGEALAQFGGSFPGGGRRGGMRGGDSDRSSQRAPQAEKRAGTFHQSLEELRIDLKLDAAQQPAWNAYAEKLVALLSDVARARAQRGGELGTADQQLERLLSTAQNRATALEDAVLAAKALYARLTPEQRTLADGRLANVTALALESRERR